MFVTEDFDTVASTVSGLSSAEKALFEGIGREVQESGAESLAWRSLKGKQTNVKYFYSQKVSFMARHCLTEKSNVARGAKVEEALGGPKPPV